MIKYVNLFCNSDRIIIIEIGMFLTEYLYDLFIDVI